MLFLRQIWEGMKRDLLGTVDVGGALLEPALGYTIIICGVLLSMPVLSFDWRQWTCEGLFLGW